MFISIQDVCNIAPTGVSEASGGASQNKIKHNLTFIMKLVTRYHMFDYLALPVHPLRQVLTYDPLYFFFLREVLVCFPMRP